MKQKNKNKTYYISAIKDYSLGKVLEIKFFDTLSDALKENNPYLKNSSIERNILGSSGKNKEEALRKAKEIFPEYITDSIFLKER